MNGFAKRNTEIAYMSEKLLFAMPTHTEHTGSAHHAQTIMLERNTRYFTSIC
jgi:hypothetical protein